MSRGSKRKRPGWQERRRREESDGDVHIGSVISDTAAQFSCSSKIASDFASQCRSRVEDLEGEAAFNRVAVEMWSGRSGRAADAAEALSAFAAERHRHHEALVALRARFEALATDPSLQHLHLEPVEQWRDLIRRRVFPDVD